METHREETPLALLLLLINHDGLVFYTLIMKYRNEGKAKTDTGKSSVTSR